MNIKLLPLTDTASYFDAAVAVYSEYIPGDPRYHAHFFKSSMQREDYVGLVAQWHQRIVGIAFGSRSLPGQWWHEKVAEEVGAGHPALQEAWVLTQLNVLRDFRSQGIGGLLHDAIVEKQPCDKLLLSTPIANEGAQRFYARRGWTVLHPGFAFASGDEPYMILRLSRK